VLARLAGDRIPVLLLRAPSLLLTDEVPADPGDQEVHALIDARHWRKAEAILETSSWRFELANRGWWRATCSVAYAWDDGLTIFFHRHAPAAPLPSRSLRVLERRLWEGATRTSGTWLEPDEVALTVFIATQAWRPGWGRATWRRDLELLVRRAGEPAKITDLASEAGVLGCLKGTGLQEERSGAAWRGRIRPLAWLLARGAHRKIGSRTFKGYLAGFPLLGRARMRCRFRGLTLTLGPRVFVPRAISESLVTKAMELTEGTPRATIVELGTGCGAAALALAAERPEATVHAADTSARALRWARFNRRRLRVDSVSFHRGSLLEPLPDELWGKTHVLVANVPYVPPSLAHAAWSDAPGSVGGVGDDGLGLQRKLASDAATLLRPGGFLIIQLLGDQWPGFSQELGQLGFEIGGSTSDGGSDAVAWAYIPEEAGQRRRASRT
jgi:release factor glutamine methyltransferase